MISSVGTRSNEVIYTMIAKTLSAFDGIMILMRGKYAIIYIQWSMPQRKAIDPDSRMLSIKFTISVAIVTPCVPWLKD